MRHMYFPLALLVLYTVYKRGKSVRAHLKAKDISLLKGDIFMSVFSLIMFGLVIWLIESGSRTVSD